MLDMLPFCGVSPSLPLVRTKIEAAAAALSDNQSMNFVATPLGTVTIATRQQLLECPAWQKAFAHSRKDSRYYEIVEDTILQGFDYRYFVIADSQGQARAVQPFFLLNQDLLQGAGPRLTKLVNWVRKFFPRALTIRTLMVGCAAGEGNLDHQSEDHADWVAQSLHEALLKCTRQMKAKMVVLKEFPATFRSPLNHFSSNGYTRVPSLPMTRLNIAYDNFDDYMTRALSKSMRKNLRRKFRDAEAAEAIVMQVVDDVTPYIDEVYPLYLSVYGRSRLQFEKLTKEFLCRLGSEIPDKARFFIWRQSGKAIAFSVCLLHGDSIYDEYLGLDYSIALDLHLYFYTLRDVIQWGMQNGYKWYCSSALNYDPKLHLKAELVPLDLYVAHTWKIANFMLRRVLPLLEPTRNDKTLKEFPNYAALWGEK